jgi:MerR family transcriptional regulator, Zn(II)-responsive regulator of zntA
VPSVVVDEFYLRRDKMMLVHELSKCSNATTDSIRYYTRRGILQPIRDPVNSYRYYNDSDIAKLEFIMQAKQLGFKLNEISSVLRDYQDGKSPCARVRETIQKRIIENKKLLSEKMELQYRMEKALEEWEKTPDDLVCDNTICFLIDSFFEKKTACVNNSYIN